MRGYERVRPLLIAEENGSLCACWMRTENCFGGVKERSFWRVRGVRAKRSECLPAGYGRTSCFGR